MPATLRDEVVQGDVDRAASGPVPADPALHRVIRGDHAALVEGRLADRVEQERHHGRHGLGGLAVVGTGIALPHPDHVRDTLVTQLDDDRRDPRALAVLRAGDPERVAQWQATGPRG